MVDLTGRLVPSTSSCDLPGALPTAGSSAPSTPSTSSTASIDVGSSSIDRSKGAPRAPSGGGGALVPTSGNLLAGASVVVDPSRDTSLGKLAKGAMFWTSMGKTAMQGYVGKNLGLCQYYHWDFIMDRLILGAMPIKSKFGGAGDHLSKLGRQLAIRELHLGLVVSCVEQSEFEGYGVSAVEFVQPSDWKERLGVDRVIHLVVPDYSAQLNMAQLAEVTEAMRETIDRGQGVYVHCKAGKGRSWVVAASFLVAHHGLSVPDATALLKARRPQVDPNKQQRALVREFDRYLHPEAHPLPRLHSHDLQGPAPGCTTEAPATPEDTDDDASSSSATGSCPADFPPHAESLPLRPPGDPEVLYYTLLSQALTLPLALRIQFLEDLRLSIQSGDGD